MAAIGFQRAKVFQACAPSVFYNYYTVYILYCQENKGFFLILVSKMRIMTVVILGGTNDGN